MHTTARRNITNPQQSPTVPLPNLTGRMTMPRARSTRPKPSSTPRMQTSIPRRRTQKARSRSKASSGKLAIALASRCVFANFFNLLVNFRRSRPCYSFSRRKSLEPSLHRASPLAERNPGWLLSFRFSSPEQTLPSDTPRPRGPCRGTANKSAPYSRVSSAAELACR
jgi:hypothetical protein